MNAECMQIELTITKFISLNSDKNEDDELWLVTEF